MSAVPSIRPGRAITGMSAVLVPYTADGAIDWANVEAHVARTRGAGLTPAVNMDTGYVQLLSPDERERVLDLTEQVTAGDFVAGAYVADDAGAAFDLDAYLVAAEAVARRGGTPVIFPSYGLNALPDPEWVDAHAQLAARLDRFIGFELGAMFVPYGRIVGLDAYRGLMEITQCIGAKHSSLRRRRRMGPPRAPGRGPGRLPRVHRQRPRDRHGDVRLRLPPRPLDVRARGVRGAATAMWAAGDPAFFELNDVLQYLGAFTFRDPVPAYRHDAAMWFELRGWAATDGTPLGALRRPDADRDVLWTLAERLDALEGAL